MDILLNLDLISVGITLAATVIIGFTIFFSNKESVTNRTFLYFALITAAWGLLNYLYYNTGNALTSFWVIRFVIFIGVWHAFTFFQLIYVFPKENVHFSKKYKYFLVPVVAITSIINLTPLVFKRIQEVSETGTVSKIENGPAISLFGTLIVAFILSAIYILIKKTIRTKDEERDRMKTILWGVSITFALILIFNFALPAIFNNPTFIPLSSVFIFPFIVFTSLAIYRYNLFNIKVASTAFLVLALTITILFETIFARGFTETLFKSSEFLLVILIGILLIKSVLKEVRQREQIQKLAGELEIANREQQNLIHFITHQVKGFFTKSRNIFAELMGGDYGEFPRNAEVMLEEGFKSDTKAVETVQEILNASNLRSGTVEYKKEQVDLREIVQENIAKQKPVAGNKGLTIVSDVPEHSISITGDRSLLEHVVNNLIDNAVKYTPSGKIEVSLSQVKNIVRFSVKDTGVGITKEDMDRLFSEGGRGKNSVKVNVNSTGYGLFIVKNIVEKHGGKVWAESEGAGKGSKFVVEFYLHTNR